MIKLIGCELRLNPSRGMRQPIEICLVPLSIVIPESSYGPCEAEVTFHTNLGDVTVRINLPGSNQRDFDNPSEAWEVLNKSIMQRGIT